MAEVMLVKAIMAKGMMFGAGGGSARPLAQQRLAVRKRGKRRMRLEEEVADRTAGVEVQPDGPLRTTRRIDQPSSESHAALMRNLEFRRRREQSERRGVTHIHASYRLLRFCAHGARETPPSRGFKSHAGGNELYCEVVLSLGNSEDSVEHRELNKAMRGDQHDSG